MRSFGRFVRCGVAGLTLGGASAAFSADFTWLSAPASSQWNVSDTNWSGAGSVWVNAPTNSAIFGASGTKTISAGSLVLSNLTFNSDGYTVGGGPLLMHGGFAVSSGVSALLNATVTNLFGVCEKTGAGTLVLDSGAGFTNRFSTLQITAGMVQITGGTHEIYTNDYNSIYLGFHVNGGTLLVSGGKVRTTSTGYSDIRGNLIITNGMVDLSSSRETLNAFNASGTTTVSGNGVLDVTSIRISQTLSQPALVNVNTGGVIRLNSFGIDTAANPKGGVNFNGGTVIAKSSSDFLGTGVSQWLSGITAKILAGGAIVDTTNFAITIKQPLLSGATPDGGLTKKGSGTLSLLSTNTYNGPTVIMGGTLTFAPQANTQMLFNTITCTDTNCTCSKAGNGALVLDPGPTAINRFGTLMVTAGTLVIASGTNLVTCPNSGQNAPGLRVAGGTLLMAGGYLKTTALMFVNVDGGHLLVTNGVVDTTSCNEILNSISGNGFGYTTVGGSGTILANQVRITQNPPPATNSVVTVNVGGTLSVGKFYIDTNFTCQAGMLVLNGGTVQARSDTADFLGTTATLVGNANDKWLTNILVRVREGGAVFDTAGHAISVKQPILSDVAADGGLTKRGNGTLTLLNTNVYGGATSVSGGTLRLGVATNTLLAGGTVWVSSNAVFDVNGKVQALAALGGSGTVSNNASLTVSGLVAPGGTNAVGTLTLASACPLSGEMRVNVAADGSCGRLTVQGNLDLSGLSLTLTNADPLNKDCRYVIATYTGALTGAFASATLPKRWSVQYDAANSRVYLIYNRGTLISLL